MPTVDRVLPWRRSERPPADEVAPLLTAYRARHPKAPTALITRAYLAASDAHRGLVKAIGAALPGAGWQRPVRRAVFYVMKERKRWSAGGRQKTKRRRVGRSCRLPSSGATARSPCGSTGRARQPRSCCVASFDRCRAARASWAWPRATRDCPPGPNR